MGWYRKQNEAGGGWGIKIKCIFLSFLGKKSEWGKFYTGSSNKIYGHQPQLRYGVLSVWIIAGKSFYYFEGMLGISYALIYGVTSYSCIMEIVYREWARFRTCCLYKVKMPNGLSINISMVLKLSNHGSTSVKKLYICNLIRWLFFL